LVCLVWVGVVLAEAGVVAVDDGHVGVVDQGDDCGVSVGSADAKVEHSVAPAEADFAV
jgi:hypothetical protein